MTRCKRNEIGLGPRTAAKLPPGRIRRLTGRLSHEFRLSAAGLPFVGDRDALSPALQSIPSVLCQTHPTKQVSRRHRRELERFREANPDLAFVVFDDEEVDAFMAASWGSHPIYDVYRGSQFPQMRADIFRYCLVFERGGYYCDINKAVFTSLTSLATPDTHGLVAYESNECVVFPEPGISEKMQFPEKLLGQWAFGFVPEHPILRYAIDAVVEAAPFINNRSVKNVRDAVLMTTGPGVFTRAFRRWLATGDSESVQQAGIDFDGQGVFRVKGSESLVVRRPDYYAALHNRKILVM